MGDVGVAVAIGIVTVGVGLIFYFWGRASEKTVSLTTPSIVNPDVDCTEACTQFETARQAQCRAKSAEDAAKTEMEARRTDYWAAVGTWGVLSGIAAAAIALPWPANLIVGLAFAAAATIALGVSLYLLGKLNVASEAWSAASTILSAASDAVLSARSVILSKCPPDRANACLGLPGPC